MSVKANLVRIRSSDLDSEPEPRQDFGSGKFSKFNGDIVVRRYISGNIFIHVQVVHEKQQECELLTFFRLPVFVLPLTETAPVHACRLKIFGLSDIRSGTAKISVQVLQTAMRLTLNRRYCTDFIITFRSFVAGCKLLVISSALVYFGG